MPATTAQDARRSGTLPDAELAPLAAAMRACPPATCRCPLPWDDSDTSVELLTGQLTVAVPGERLELC